MFWVVIVSQAPVRTHLLERRDVSMDVGGLCFSSVCGSKEIIHHATSVSCCSQVDDFFRKKSHMVSGYLQYLEFAGRAEIPLEKRVYACVYLECLYLGCDHCRVTLHSDTHSLAGLLVCLLENPGGRLSGGGAAGGRAGAQQQSICGGAHDKN